MSRSESGSRSWSEIDELAGDEPDGWDLPELMAQPAGPEVVSDAWEEVETSPILSVIPWQGHAEFPGHSLGVPYQCVLSETESVLYLTAPHEGLAGTQDVAIVVEGITLLVTLEVKVVSGRKALVLGRSSLAGQVLIEPSPIADAI